jgi:hypothetical protein
VSWLVYREQNSVKEYIDKSSTVGVVWTAKREDAWLFQNEPTAKSWIRVAGMAHLKAGVTLGCEPKDPPPVTSSGWASGPFYFMAGVGGGGGSSGGFEGASGGGVSKPARKLHSCKRCNQQNPYAEANQKDGTYVCFDCRR